MAESGTATARIMRVFRSRIASLWTVANGKIWWPEAEFTPPAATSPPAAPAGILRFEMNRTFEEANKLGRRTVDGRGSISLFFGVQNRPGRLDAEEAAEADIRAIADPDNNIHSEQVWTTAAVERNPGATPTGCPEDLRRAFAWSQYVIAFDYAEAA